jgi:hypothetical protein
MRTPPPEIAAPTPPTSPVLRTIGTSPRRHIAASSRRQLPAALAVYLEAR